MTSTFGSAFRSFWHTMTSNDRHSTYDSPYRTGRHVPLSRQSTLTSVATASDSRADVTLPYRDEAGRLASGGGDPGTAYMGAGLPSPSPLTHPSTGPNRPYSPGLRSMGARQSSKDGNGFETVSSPGEIPMQSFADGLPPAPPVQHSWRRIDKWCEENYPELYDQLCEPCSNNDLNDLEHQLDCSLPQDVRDSLMAHDGQERGGLPTGIIFGCMLLDCEEIVQEWDQWCRVNHEYLLDNTVVNPAVPLKAFGGNGTAQASSSRSNNASPAGSATSNWRQELFEKQKCVPEGAVQKAYAHPAWIPLVRDWGGNNLAVDLAPGSTGTWGQIILFGRDFDTKYVVAKSWAALMATVSDDLNSGKWYIDEETNELKLREFKVRHIEPSYFDILRWRTDQKCGGGAKSAAKRKSVVPGRVSSTASSPYSSPTDAPGEARGRTLQRLSSPSPLASPARPGYSKASPLARVTEEAGSATKPRVVTNGIKTAPLVEVDTPRGAATPVDPGSPDGAELDKGKENGKQLEEAMKTIEI